MPGRGKTVISVSEKSVAIAYLSRSQCCSINSVMVLVHEFLFLHHSATDTWSHDEYNVEGRVMTHDIDASVIKQFLTLEHVFDVCM